MATGYTWNGADGGSWQTASNWVDSSGSVGVPGSLDLAQFVSFSGTVTGAAGASLLDIGPGSSLTLGGSGFFSQINIGQDFNFNVGVASMTIGSGDVVSATLLDIGTTFGGTGALIASGTFSTTGGIEMDLTPVAGTIVVNSGGAVFDGVSLTMADGGRIQVGSSGQMVIGGSSGGGVNGALTVNSGFVFSGEGTIAANLVDNGSFTTFNGGYPANTLTVTGNVAGTGSLSAVQELDINGAIGSGIKISLFGNGGTNAGLLRLGQPSNDAGTLVTMSTNSTIALTGLSYDHAQWTTGTLEVTGASGTLDLATSGDHSFQTFVTRPDAISGTDILVLACFAAGARIMTANGPLAVETLRPGDRVSTRFGGLLPIEWIGRRHVECDGHGCSYDVSPVRIRAGAFGRGLPSQDLLLSPDHAVYLDGFLVPIRYLINGETIVRERVKETDYYHIALPMHDIIEANGLPCESFLDTGDRSAFDNATDLPPPARPAISPRLAWEAMACAPIMVAGPGIERIRARLARHECAEAARSL